MQFISKPVRVNKHFTNVASLLVHSTCLIYICMIFYQAIMGILPGDPVQFLLDFTGIGALNLLLMSLCVSPLSRFLKFSQLMRLRKTIGVYAGFYALSHFLVFIAFELQFEWLLIASEIVERPYITVGFVALLILITLLITSLNIMKRRLKKTWQSIHNFVYLALILGCLHYLWALKTLEFSPIIYAIIALVLLLLRKDKIKKIFK